MAALSNSGFKVVVHDKAFDDPVARATFLHTHPAAEIILADNPATLVAQTWKLAGKLNTIVCNDHYPAVQASSEKVCLDEFRKTLEYLVIYPFELLQAAIPFLRSQRGLLPESGFYRRCQRKRLRNEICSGWKTRSTRGNWRRNPFPSVNGRKVSYWRNHRLQRWLAIVASSPYLNSDCQHSPAHATRQDIDSMRHRRRGDVTA